MGNMLTIDAEQAKQTTLPILQKGIENVISDVRPMIDDVKQIRDNAVKYLNLAIVMLIIYMVLFLILFVMQFMTLLTVRNISKKLL